MRKSAYKAQNSRINYASNVYTTKEAYALTLRYIVCKHVP